MFRLVLPDPDQWSRVDLLKFAVTNSDSQPPAYNVIQTTLYANRSVAEGHPGLPHNWSGTWDIDFRLDQDWLAITTGDYLNVISLHGPRLTSSMSYEAIEHRHLLPTGVKYTVVVLSFTLKNGIYSG
jgi:hypothetical protein